MFSENSVFLMFWEGSENQFGQPEKNKVVRLIEIFLKICPHSPLLKILDSPLLDWIKILIFWYI